MTDANRRKLIILAEARTNAIDVTPVLQRLRINLDRLEHSEQRHKAARTAHEILERLIEIEAWITTQIGEVPS